MTLQLIESPIADAAPLPRAIVFAEYFPPYMGSDRRIFDLVKNASRWHFEFAVVPPLRILGGRCEDALEEYFDRHFVRGVVDEDTAGIHGHYFPLPEWLMKLWRSLPLHISYALTVPYLALRCADFLRRVSPDVVVVAHPSYLCGAVGLIAARLARIPAVLDYPDAWTPLAVETAGIDARGLTARILHGLETLIARSAQEIVSITHGLASYVRALGSKANISIVPNGADDGVFARGAAPLTAAELSLTDSCEVILYSGRLEPWSGVHELAETIQRVCEKRPTAKFVFVGDGTAAQQLREEIANLKLEGKAVFLGFQRFFRMPHIIASARLAIVPFPDTPTTRVCAPVKLFEYMLMEKPIITTDLPGIRESIDEQHAVFVGSLSAVELSSAILDLLEDEERAKKIARAGFDLAQQDFTWKKLSRTFENVLSRLTSRELV